MPRTRATVAKLALSDDVPADMPAAGAAGTGLEAARDDHIHPNVDHINAFMRLGGGTTWSGVAGSPNRALLDANAESITYSAVIGSGYVRFRFRTFYAASANRASAIYVSRVYCGGTLSTWNIVNGTAVNFNSGGDTTLACYLTDWSVIDGNPCKVAFQIYRTAGGALYCFQGGVEVDTEGS